MVQKYLISIESEDSQRFQGFFEKNNFKRDDFKIFGVIGAKLTAKQYYTLGVAQAVLPLTPSEVGCKESHLQALHDFLSTDSKYAWVFEDDITFYDKIVNIDDADIDGLGESFLMLLGGVSGINKRSLKGQILGDFIGYPIIQVHPYFMTGVHGTYAYLIDRRAAEKVIEFHSKPRLIDDWDGFVKENKGIRFLMSDIFYHPTPADSGFFSYIYDERHEKHQQAGNAFNKISFFYLLMGYISRMIFKAKKSCLRRVLNSYPNHRRS